MLRVLALFEAKGCDAEAEYVQLVLNRRRASNERGLIPACSKATPLYVQAESHEFR